MSNQTLLILTIDRQIDRRTLQQADTLEKLGWVVTILAMPNDHSFSIDDPRVVRIRMEKRTLGLKHFYLLSLYQRIRRLLPMNGRFMQVLKRILWGYVVYPDELYCQLFANDLKNYTPKVVMAVDLPMLSVAFMHAGRCDAKLVYDSHELYSEQEFSSREKQQWQSIEEKFIGQCDAVITVNPSIAAELEGRYGVKSVHVIFNAIDSTTNFLSAQKVPLDETLIRPVGHLLPKGEGICSSVLSQQNKRFHQVFKLPLERKILLFQGGLSKGRHLETLVRAMNHIKHQYVDLVILGDGQLRQALERLAHSLGIKHRVHFHSAVPQEQLLEYTQSADAGVIPYQATCLNNYYCTPNKMFEFIAAGLPILGSDLPEINNIVLKHQLGLTGNMSCAKVLAQLIDEFFINEEQLEQWKKNILIAQQQFSWRHEEKKLVQIFEALI
jgi:glycosyltransferase involved in cell wall biosynthesis